MPIHPINFSTIKYIYIYICIIEKYTFLTHFKFIYMYHKLFFKKKLIYFIKHLLIGLKNY